MLNAKHGLGAATKELAALQPNDIHIRLMLRFNRDRLRIARVICVHPLGPDFEQSSTMSTLCGPADVYNCCCGDVLVPC